MLELNIFGDDARFEHVGLAVNSIRDAVRDDLEIFCDEIQNVSVAFVNMNGIRVELIEPRGTNSPITSSLKGGRKLVHLCFRVRDLEAAIVRGRGHGFHCIAKPVPAVAFGNKRIAWLFNKIYGLVELVEE